MTWISEGDLNILALIVRRDILGYLSAFCVRMDVNNTVDYKIQSVSV